MQSLLEKLDKINVASKKTLENILNNLHEAQLLVENSRNSSNISFQHVDSFVLSALSLENKLFLKTLREFLEKIANFCNSFAKNLDFFYDNFANSLENSKKTAISQCLDLELLQKSLVLNKNPKETRKVFILMKLLGVSWKISEDLGKDLAHKQEIAKRFEENTVKIQGNGDILQELKYYAQIWVHRPAIREENIEYFSDLLQIFCKSH